MIAPRTTKDKIQAQTPIVIVSDCLVQSFTEDSQRALHSSKQLDFEPKLLHLLAHFASQSVLFALIPFKLIGVITLISLCPWATLTPKIPKAIMSLILSPFASPTIRGWLSNDFHPPLAFPFPDLMVIKIGESNPCPFERAK
ncbi:unnamed protein product [Blepharisma stoltei]|uniref:Uncharacterized protein n=1 Tax=Blepharisma stoltei TaxID=1481888 RepID=A0AAU9JFM5_9CILI|nr:unnamed protein product [Blepharisma stoltei]